LEDAPNLDVAEAGGNGIGQDRTLVLQVNPLPKFAVDGTLDPSEGLGSEGWNVGPDR